MKMKLVSFRYAPHLIRDTDQLSFQNHMDLSSYIVFSLMHYIRARARMGEIEMPDFLKGR